MSALTDWIDAVKLMGMLLALITALAGYLGYDSVDKSEQIAANKKQLTTVVNYYYSGCELGGDHQVPTHQGQ